MRRRLLPKGLPALPVYTLAAWGLGILAIASMLVLDHRNWVRGEASYIFTGGDARKRAAAAQASAPPAVPAESKPASPEPGKEPGPETAPPPVSAPVVRPSSGKPAAPLGRVALVMDDMGNSLEALEELLELTEPLTIAVLPFGSHAAETARRANEKGLQVLLHLPLESLNGNGQEAATEGLIRTGMGVEEIRSLVSGELDRIPHVRGVNNHMGSKVTADAEMMRAILEPVRERGLFFLDSRTTGRSVAFDVAVEMGIPAVSRQVFLDADGDARLIRERLMELFRLARRDGQAVGICHPFKETLRTLRESFGGLRAQGLEAVFISDLVR
jgi:polysaccharide deacetylase 2 family uncharacterized protein YibQ